MLYRLGIPYVRRLHLLRSSGQPVFAVMYRRRVYFPFREYPRYLRGAVGLHAQGEYFLYDLRRFFIREPFLFILLVLFIPVGRAGTEMFPRVAFGFEHRANFLARILRVPFVDDVPKGREVAVRSALVVHAVVHGDEVYAAL